MKIDILLFTQTMHSLLSSCLSLQSALKVCSEILADKREKTLVLSVFKKVNEGKKFSLALSDYKKEFSPLYISLVAIGEESGTLAEVFGHLSSYLKDKRNMNRKIIQALMYPAMVLITAVAVVIILTVFVMPRLEGIFEAFSVSSDMAGQMIKVKARFIVSVVITAAVILAIVIATIMHKTSTKAAFMIDGAMLRIPVVKKIVLTMQMNDFSFAMRLMADTHFPLVQSLAQAKDVLRNGRIKNAVASVCKNITDGMAVGEAFEKEKIFPNYFIVWIKIAEENGNTPQAFKEISDYYRFENENILSDITQSAEPVFILITGAIIISVIAQFVIPVFNLLGAL